MIRKKHPNHPSDDVSHSDMSPYMPATPLPRQSTHMRTVPFVLDQNNLMRSWSRVSQWHLFPHSNPQKRKLLTGNRLVFLHPLVYSSSPWEEKALNEPGGEWPQPILHLRSREERLPLTPDLLALFWDQEVEKQVLNFSQKIQVSTQASPRI